MTTEVNKLLIRLLALLKGSTTKADTPVAAASPRADTPDEARLPKASADAKARSPTAEVRSPTTFEEDEVDEEGLKVPDCID